jgi:hypothetical protein
MAEGMVEENSSGNREKDWGPGAKYNLERQAPRDLLLLNRLHFLWFPTASVIRGSSLCSIHEPLKEFANPNRSIPEVIQIRIVYFYVENNHTYLFS